MFERRCTIVGRCYRFAIRNHPFLVQASSACMLFPQFSRSSGMHFATSISKPQTLFKRITQALHTFVCISIFDHLTQLRVVSTCCFISQRRSHYVFRRQGALCCFRTVPCPAVAIMGNKCHAVALPQHGQCTHDATVSHTCNCPVVATLVLIPAHLILHFRNSKACMF